MPTSCPDCGALVQEPRSRRRNDGDHVLDFRCRDCGHEWTVTF